MTDLLATSLPSHSPPRDKSGALQPVIPGFFPDPTVCRVGDDFYVANSSFEYFPGAPIFHSTDLVTWSQIGNIFTRRSQFRLTNPGPSTGIYGSTLRHHGGRFWFVTTNVSDFSSGQVLVSTTDPAGEWSEPVFVPDAIGIDPDLCWDDDGTCYLSWHSLDFEVGAQGILQAPIDLATGELLEPAYPIWQGSGLAAAEGPHLYRVGDYWYVFLAEGGTERGHCVTVARGRSPRGPFESCPSNPVFTHRSSIHPVQNVGHADIVEGPDGRWAAVYLGARTRGSTPGFHVLGRETFLAGIDWVDDWPMFDEERFEVPAALTGFTDDFSSAALDPRWIVPNGEPAAVASPREAGGLRVNASAGGSTPLCVRVRDLAWTAAAAFDGQGELRLLIDDRHWCAVRVVAGRAVATVRVGDVESELGAVDIGDAPAVLRLQSVAPASPQAPIGRGGPDDIVIGVVVGAEHVELGRIDGRYFSTEVASGFTGRMLAVGSAGATTVLKTFTYAPA